MNQMNLHKSQTYQHSHTKGPNIALGGYLGAIENLRCHPIQSTSVRINSLKTKRRVGNVRKPKICEQGMAIVRYHNVKLTILIKSNSSTRRATYTFHITVVDRMRMTTMEIIQPSCNSLQLKQMRGAIRNTFFDRFHIGNLPKGGDPHLCFGHIGMRSPCASTRKLLILWNRTE